MKVGIRPSMRMSANSAATFDVFDLSGKKVASFTARSMVEATKLWRESAQSQKVQGFCLIRNRSNGMVAKIRTTR